MENNAATTRMAAALAALAALALAVACALALPAGAWALDASALAPGQAGVSLMEEAAAEPAAGEAGEEQPAPPSLESAVIGPIESFTYDGKAKTPEPTVQLDGATLVNGQDYTLSYSSNKNAGKASVTVTGIGGYTGAKSAGFTIKKASISKAKVAKIKKRTATGKAQKPKPTVKMSGKKLKSGRDYKLSYKNNKAAGTAKVILKGKGNFKGKKVVKFKIVAPAAARAASAPAPAATGVGEVYITNTGAKFHRGTCRWLYASKIPISRADAIAQGYEACKVCKP